MYDVGDTVVRWLVLSPHSRKVLSSNLLAYWGLFMQSLHVLPVLVSASRYSCFLPQSADLQWYSKMPIGVNGCVSLCWPCDRLVTYPGCTPTLF